MSINLPVSSNSEDFYTMESVTARKTDASAKSVDIGTVQSKRELEQAELQGQKVTISEEQLIRSIERAIKAMQGSNTTLEFSIHKATNEVVVKVLEKETGKVIREIPPEKNLDFVAKMIEMSGILMDERR